MKLLLVIAGAVSKQDRIHDSISHARWAGAVTEVTEVMVRKRGPESTDGRSDRPADRQTDRRTNPPTHQPTDRVTYTIACTRLKISFPVFTNDFHELKHAICMAVPVA